MSLFYIIKIQLKENLIILASYLKKSMSIEYKIDTDSRIIYEFWSPKVTFDDYKAYKEKLFIDKEYDPTFDVISDLREFTLNFEVEELDKIVNLFLDHPDKIMKRKSALITNNPKQVAAGMIFQTKSSVTPVNVMVFSTPEAANDWITGKSKK
jgi:hypothetical protein